MWSSSTNQQWGNIKSYRPCKSHKPSLFKMGTGLLLGESCHWPKFCSKDGFKILFGRTRPDSSHIPIIRIRSYNRVAKLGRFCPLFNHCPKDSKLSRVIIKKGVQLSPWSIRGKENQDIRPPKNTDSPWGASGVPRSLSEILRPPGCLKNSGPLGCLENSGPWMSWKREF